MPLSVGIPKEIKANEKRVGITPECAKELTSKGIVVNLESKAGALSGFSDEAYIQAGVKIFSDKETLYGSSRIILKVKEPLAEEFPLLTKKHLLFCFLHLASHENKAIVRALIQKQVTAIGFEAVEENGVLPLLKPMSEIAGALGVAYGLYFSDLRLIFGEEIVYPGSLACDLGKFAEYYPCAYKEIAKKKVLIYGAGIAGQSAYKMAEFMASEALLVEKNDERREDLDKAGFKVISSDDVSKQLLSQTDVFIGAAHARGMQAAKVLKKEDMKFSKECGTKIFVDIAIDQGGNFPDSKSTSYADPLYLDSWGNLRCGVPNLPAMSGGAASRALAEASLIYVKKLALEGEEALTSGALKKGLNTMGGKIILNEVREAHPEMTHD